MVDHQIGQMLHIYGQPWRQDCNQLPEDELDSPKVWCSALLYQNDLTSSKVAEERLSNQFNKSPLRVTEEQMEKVSKPLVIAFSEQGSQ